ncbi:MAG: MerR family transcriptional regulator [Gammaproteobacteria bacterium]|nr:MerR family transcriptional regulator [Gammaproteobacteria bacterium]
MNEELLTIGTLAKRANVATSLIRFYEKKGLLIPAGRTDAGYRLYPPEAERWLRFIRSAQRHGFSLADITLMVNAHHDPDDDGEGIRNIAEQRFLEIERRVTEMLVLRHEMELFLDDVAAQLDRTAGKAAGQHYRDLLEQVCGHDNHNKRTSSLRKLVDRLNCNLATAEWESLLDELRGQHIHIWREEAGYAILVATQEARVKDALERLAASESGCNAHVEPKVEAAESGLLFRAQGDNAFLFAQLFMALEATEA